MQMSTRAPKCEWLCHACGLHNCAVWVQCRLCRRSKYELRELCRRGIKYSNPFCTGNNSGEGADCSRYVGFGTRWSVAHRTRVTACVLGIIMISAMGANPVSWFYCVLLLVASSHHIHTFQLPFWRGRSNALMYEGMTHVMLACRMDLWSAQLLSVRVLYINGPSAFRGSPEYTQ